MRYFFVGIGGVSMSALAKLLWHRGDMVMGSDAVESDNTRELQQMGIKIYLGHKSENIQQQKIDRLVINGAIADDNPELLQARLSGIKIVYRENILASLSRHYQQVIAIAGCHGKSSSTAMVGDIFQAAGRYPTVHNGVKNNLRIGGKKYFITEACEFRKSFLKLKPKIALITNVDADHLDCYHGIDEIKKCFAKFANKSDIVIKNASDDNSLSLHGKQRTITFGLNCGDVHAKHLRVLPDQTFEFDIILNSQVFGTYYQIPRFRLPVHGLHNVINALGAIACGLICGVNLSAMQQALANYQGIARRFQTFTKLGKTPVILDYAHHPNEIKTTIQTAQALYPKYLLVFQPHTYTRTLSLWDDFVSVLGQVKNLVLYKTYAARGKVIVGGRALDLSRRLKAKYVANTQTLLQFLKDQSVNYDAIILCGAGDVVSGDFLLTR